MKSASAREEETMFRFGIVGCGGMGNHHSNVFSKMEDVKIVAACDLIKEKADALAENFGAKPCYDFHDLLGEVDVICDCTPPLSRPGIVIDCARAGKNIFSEKPLALSIESANKMVEAVEKAGIEFMTDYVLRFVNPYRIAHDIFETGELGRLVNVWTRRYMPIDMRPLWYGDDAKSGGIAMDFMSHDLDQLRWFGGKVKTVFGHVDRVREGIQGDEHAQALLLFEQGMGTSDVSWWSPLSTSSFGVIGTRGSIIVDAKGKIRKRIDGQEETVIDANAGMATDLQGVIDKGEEKKTGSSETVQEHFVRSLRENLTPLVTIHEAREVLKIVLAIKESARTGKSVDL